MTICRQCRDLCRQNIAYSHLRCLHQGQTWLGIREMCPSSFFATLLLCEAVRFQRIQVAVIVPIKIDNLTVGSIMLSIRHGPA
jgi:hypothetical protein